MEWDVDFDFEYDPGEYDCPRRLYSEQIENSPIATACQNEFYLVSLTYDQSN